MSESLKQKAKTGFEIETEIGSLRCMNVGTAKQKIGRDKRLQTLLEDEWVRLEDAQQEIDDCRTEATKELLNLAIHGLKEAQNGESSDCVSTFATIIEKLGIHVEYDEWHEPIIDVEQVKTVLDGNGKEKVKPA